MMNEGMKRLLAGVLTATLVVGGVTAQPTEVQAAGAVKIDAKHFPDANFRKAVKLFDDNKNGKLDSEENKQIKSIVASKYYFEKNAVRNGEELGGKFKKIKGCEYLTSVEYLYAECLMDTTYDLSKLKKLNDLFIRSCDKLTSVNVKNLSKLRDIRLDGCDKIKSLDVSTLSNLTEVNVEFCKKFTTLKTSSKNKKLNRVEEIYSDAVKSVDLSKVKSLKSYYTNSKNFDYKKSKFNDISKLKNLEISNCKTASAVDTKKLKSIEHLDLRNGGLTKIDLSANTKLISLELEGNKLTSVDLSANTKLTSLNLSGNKLTDIDVSAQKVLNWITLIDSDVESLDFSANKELTDVNILNNKKLKSINLSNNTNLSWLSCGGCDLLDMVSVKSAEARCGLSVSENTKIMIQENNVKRMETNWDEEWNKTITEYDISNPIDIKEWQAGTTDITVKGDSGAEYNIYLYTPYEYEE